jgi:hypothetical protein
LSRVEAINFNWKGGAPSSLVPKDSFSARWEGLIEPKYSENYTFFLRSDDAARLWIDNQLIIDSWTPHTAATYIGRIYLVGGKKYSIKLDYFEKTGNALVQLKWESGSQRNQVVPKSRLYTNITSQPPIITIPNQPTGFVGVPNGSSITLRWNDVQNETSYSIERSTSATTGFVQIASLSANVISYTDNGLTSGTTYYYRIRASNSAGSSAYSLTSATTQIQEVQTNIALNKATTGSSTEPGTSFTASLATDGNAATRWSSDYIDPSWIQIDLGETYNINRVVLNWEAASGKSFQIQTSNDGNSWQSIYSTTISTGGLQDLTVSGSGRYVRMYGTERNMVFGYSLWEFEIYGVSQPVTIPVAPSSLTATPTSSSVSLNWLDNSNNELGFKVDCSTSGGTFTSIATLSSGVRSFVDSGLAANTSYSYRVYAYNGAGNSGYASVSTRTNVSLPVSGIFVSTGGSDSNLGTIDAPFRTIQKAASVARAGDTVYIRTGTYRETVSPVNSGTVSAPITFMPYNNEIVTVSGADIISGWTLHSGNIYRAPMSWTLNEENDQVFVDGVMMNLARWPNTGTDPTHQTYGHIAGASVSASGSMFTISDPALSSGWTGATVHIASGRLPNLWETPIVTSSSAGSLTYHSNWYSCHSCGASDFDMYDPVAGNSYYITDTTGRLDLLDSGNEWYLQSGQLYLWTPAGDSPSNHIVEAKRRDMTFDLRGKSYINLVGLNTVVGGINMSGTTHHITITKLNAKYISHFTYSPQQDPWSNIHVYDNGIIMNGNYNSIRNSTIQYSAGHGILVLGNHTVIDNNIISDVDYAGIDNSGIFVGINAGSYSSPKPMNISSEDTVITHNTIFNSQRGLILHRMAPRIKIMYNHLYNAGLSTGDGGATYAYEADGTGSEISYNVIHDASDIGIYLDNSCHDFLVHHNVVYNVRRALTLNTVSTNNLIYSNTLVGNTYSLYTGWFNGGYFWPGVQVKNNILIGSQITGSGATMLNNLQSNPQFVNQGAGNFQLQSTSPAINAGLVISPYTDGSVGAPDIGAYEYGKPAWTAGAVF